eukprot:TRINITY_DN21867_c0_g1_i1.p1 TRINITY_DN21867_c0_g1~~TRINITY_DN21867_c0_g1_i1.p1  ORF type:complete len:191 (+),score=18.45 TRINITY_DN21867_c0_g1_i1:45-575(+)
MKKTTVVPSESITASPSVETMDETQEQHLEHHHPSSNDTLHPSQSQNSSPNISPKGKQVEFVDPTDYPLSGLELLPINVVVQRILPHLSLLDVLRLTQTCTLMRQACMVPTATVFHHMDLTNQFGYRSIDCIKLLGDRLAHTIKLTITGNNRMTDLAMKQIAKHAPSLTHLDINTW